MSPVIDEIFRIFGIRGSEEYGGEAVSQLEHALQTAALATSEGVQETLVAAALLHDIGHLLPNGNIHEENGHEWLSQSFPSAVTEPVRLHVAAKRYLCTVDPAYSATLSPASVRSLAVQGGPMTSEEVTKFEGHPHFTAAVRLRRWDDEAKV
ncbi:MAG: HD domain-containing protein, partial [Bryobacteraceae bacterium]|nr:HD domain-containing protein [Bryobacteraceae bacterium]